MGTDKKLSENCLCYKLGILFCNTTSKQRVCIHLGNNFCLLHLSYIEFQLLLSYYQAHGILHQYFFLSVSHQLALLAEFFMSPLLSFPRFFMAILHSIDPSTDPAELFTISVSFYSFSPTTESQNGPGRDHSGSPDPNFLLRQHHPAHGRDCIQTALEYLQ